MWKLLKMVNEWVSEVAQSCPTFCDPMDCRLPGFSVHGILQTRILECCHFLLQGIFPTQGSNPGLLHCRQEDMHIYWLRVNSSLHAWCTWPRWQTPHGLFISHFMYRTHLSARETGYHIPVKNFWRMQLSEKTLWWYTSSCTLLA